MKPQRTLSLTAMEHSRIKTNSGKCVTANQVSIWTSGLRWHKTQV